MDLADLDSVRKAAKTLLARDKPIDILMNNAGIAWIEGITAQGFEIQFGTNLLGPILLTEMLLPLLKKSPKARIVNMSSILGWFGKRYDWDKVYGPAFSISRRPLQPYNDSKLGVAAYTKRLGQLLKDSNVTCYSVHPGTVATEIFGKALPWYIAALINPFCKSPEEGAQTQIFCAIEDGIEKWSGLFFAECRPVKYFYSGILDDQKYVEDVYLKCRELVKDYLD